MDRAGISIAPLPFARRRSAVPSFILPPLLFDEASDVGRARCLNRFPNALQITQELIHGSHGGGYDTLVVSTLFEVFSELANEGRRARSWGPLPLDESQDSVYRTPGDPSPLLWPFDQIRVLPLREFQRDPQVVHHIGRLNPGRIESAPFQVLEEEAGGPLKDVRRPYAPFSEVLFEGLE